MGPMSPDSQRLARDQLMQAGPTSVVLLVSTGLSHTSATGWLFWGWLSSTCLSSRSRVQQASLGMLSWPQTKCRSADGNTQDFLRTGSKACLPHSINQSVSHGLNSESGMEKCPCPFHGRNCEVI